jgi:hypothetical protein
LRAGITGGLSNVGHRINIAGLTHIVKLELVKYADGSIHVFSVDINNIMTHITGCDFSSLYPSVFSSNEHPFIPYTGHRMYMPGYQTARFNKTNSEFAQMLDIIKNPDRFECENEEIIAKVPWIVACAKGHIDEEYLNDSINFAPIIKKLTFTTDLKTMGPRTYEHLENNGLTRDKEETKLTQLLSTHDQYWDV